jgi:hypothetical protein
VNAAAKIYRRGVGKEETIIIKALDKDLPEPGRKTGTPFAIYGCGINPSKLCHS